MPISGISDKGAAAALLTEPPVDAEKQVIGESVTALLVHTTFPFANSCSHAIESQTWLLVLARSPADE
jgi:hypothetical protein